MGFKLGILISGNGSNMLNIINASKKSIINSKVATVVSNNPKALGIQKAKDNRINFKIINENDYKNVSSYNAMTQLLFNSYKIRNYLQINID